MHFTSEQRLDDGVLEREFTLGEIPGVLWTPASAAPAPLILIGHPPLGLRRMHPRLVGRPGTTAEYGFAAATIELPGSGERPRSAAAEQARADLRRAMEAGEPVDEIVDALVLPLVEKAVPEWQATLDALLSLPEIGGPVGYAGMTAIGIRLAVVEPRIAAAGFFAGGFVPGALREEARQVTIPLQFLLQWDDEGNERQRGPGPVRRLRHQGEDAARQSGRARRRPVVRGGRRGPVLRPAPEVRPGRQASSRR